MHTKRNLGTLSMLSRFDFFLAIELVFGSLHLVSFVTILCVAKGNASVCSFRLTLSTGTRIFVIKQNCPVIV